MDICESLRDLFIRINTPKTFKSSIVWDYFGYLYKKPKQPLDDNYVYCKVCFDKFKEDQPDVVLSLVRKKIGVYNATSSTGNMKHHLLTCHQITDPYQMKTTHEHVQALFSRNRYVENKYGVKERLSHQLTLMCCRDLLPFSIVEKEGRQIYL